MAAKAPTLPQHITIAQLHKRGFSYAQIAKTVGITPDQVRDSLTAARQLLEAFAGRFAADYIRASAKAAEKGDHRPARDMLDRLHVTEPVGHTDTGTNVGIRVQVTGFTLPGLPLQVHADGAVHTGTRAAAAPPLTLDVASTEPAHTEPTSSEAVPVLARDAEPSR
jgi:lambda repressor-like predicted transcriptional regulator